MSEKNITTLKAEARDSIVEKLNLTAGTQIDTAEYVFPVETEIGTLYTKVKVTVCNHKDTKTTEAFDLEKAVEKYNAKLSKAAAKKAEREAKKASKAKVED